MTASSVQTFKGNYEAHLKLKGLQPKTIEAYVRAIRRIGAYFDHQISELADHQHPDAAFGGVLILGHCCRLI